MDVMQKAQQLQAALVALFAPIQARPQPTIDALGQHAPAPRAPQHRADRCPGSRQLRLPQQRDGAIQIRTPRLMVGLPVGPWQGLAVAIRIALPEPAQGLDRLRAPLPNQRRQSCPQYRDRREQSAGLVAHHPRHFGGYPSARTGHGGAQLLQCDGPGRGIRAGAPRAVFVPKEAACRLV